MAKTKKEPSAPQDELRTLLDGAMSAFVITKRRYLLLIATLAEWERVEKRMDELAEGKTRHRGNDAVVQMLRDSFDMLVIDLASIRESMVERKGLLGRLKSDLHVHIRQCASSDLKPRSVVAFGTDHDGIRAEYDAAERRSIAKAVNTALGEMFPGGFPVTSNAVGKLIERFIRDTDAIDKDRNHVRAHRYEHRPFDRTKYFCPPDAVGEHLKVIEKYLVDLYFVVTWATYHAHLDFNSGAKRVAEDLADLIVHGSIGHAVTACGMSHQSDQNPHPWYWYHRKTLLDGPEPWT